ncbi:hypothetical protein [Streptomyces sp. NPDC037389]|uniref:hypothetical protein n=1 Tax=Streptomyces sp. NPDC037389 TaxID=3155369 RepID=UPI00340EF748
MPDARTDTTEARPLIDASAAQAAAAGTGRHRGPVSPDDNAAASAATHGKHRREAD